MATFTKTITNTVSVWGPEPTEKYASAASAAALLYGTDYWAYGTVGLPIVFYKPLANGVSVTGETNLNFTKRSSNAVGVSNTVYKQLTKVSTNTVSMADTLAKGFVLANSIATTATVSRAQTKTFLETMVMVDTPGLYRYRNGYASIYGGVSNVVNWPRDNSTLDSSPVTSWTVQSAAVTVWS